MGFLTGAYGILIFIQATSFILCIASMFHFQRASCSGLFLGLTLRCLLFPALWTHFPQFHLKLSQSLEMHLVCLRQFFNSKIDHSLTFIFKYHIMIHNLHILVKLSMIKLTWFYHSNYYKDNIKTGKVISSYEKNYM